MARKKAKAYSADSRISIALENITAKFERNLNLPPHIEAAVRFSSESASSTEIIEI